jgi:hypothetical protein
MENTATPIHIRWRIAEDAFFANFKWRDRWYRIGPFDAPEKAREYAEKWLAEKQND